MKKTFTYQWTRKRNTKQVRISRINPGQSEEGRHYYSHNHILEQEKAEMTGTFEVEIDTDAIAQLVIRSAALSQSGKSVRLGGLIKAKRKAQTVLSAQTQANPIPEGYSEI